MIVILTEQAEKDLMKMDKLTRERFIKKIDDIHLDKVRIEKLDANPDRWKVKVGQKWRILLVLSEDQKTVTILACGARKDIYEKRLNR